MKPSKTFWEIKVTILATVTIFPSSQSGIFGGQLTICKFKEDPSKETLFFTSFSPLNFPEPSFGINSKFFKLRTRF